MNNEIKRLLRSLDEACTERGITIDDAVAWFKTLDELPPLPLPKEKTFRNIAEELVNASSCAPNSNQQDICVEILCMAHEAREEILLAEDIVNHLFKCNLIPEKFSGRTIAKTFIYSFLTDYYHKQGFSSPSRIIGKKNWRSIAFALRNLVKTLN